MTINKTYIRTSPRGESSEVTPKNQDHVDYYRSYEDHGFTLKPKVVIHSSPSVCVSCEG